MRILVAHSDYRIKGGENAYVSALVELIGRRHHVSTLRPDNSELAPGLRTAGRMAWSPRVSAAVRARIDEVDPDVIHVHNVYPSLGPAVHLAARRRGLPLVMTVHNHRLRCPNGVAFTDGAPCTRCYGGNHLHAVAHDCLQGRAQSAAYAAVLWAHRFVLPLERLVTTFVAPSEYMAGQLRAWGIASRRIAVVPNFAAPLAEDPVPPGDGGGVYIGRLSFEKGLPDLLDALARAGDPPFTIVGDGPLDAELRRHAVRLGLRRLGFAGRLEGSGVRDVVLAASYLVMPSTCAENAPLAALEAMSAGRPVVVADAGGLPELVATGGGITFPPGDADALAAAIGRLSDDPEEAAAMGRSAFERYRRHHTPERHLEQLERCYQEAVA